MHDMHASSVLHAAVRAAPRRYLLPPLPADAAAARLAAPATALAWAIEAARRGGAHAEGEAREVFVDALAALIGNALAPGAGDASFQSLVLRAQQPEVEEHARLLPRLHGHRRSVRSAVDAVAHPGKTRHLPAGPERELLSRLHALAREGHWSALRDASATALPAVHGSAALADLVRAEVLSGVASVQRYEQLCRRRGPQARSDHAAAQGRSAAQVGDDAEQATLDAFRRICELLRAAERPPPILRVVQALRPPAGFQGDAHKAKDEWDAAILGAAAPTDPADVLLLAEVKASPAAATPDWWRLHRGLQRLANADADSTPEFTCAQGRVRLAGASLRALAPHGSGLPPQVIYCCTSAAETQPAMLSAATQAVLLAEPPAIAFACALAAQGRLSTGVLLPVWEALVTQPRLRSALHQYDTSCKARAVMLHPDELLAAVRAQLAHQEMHRDPLAPSPSGRGVR